MNRTSSFLNVSLLFKNEYLRNETVEQMVNRLFIDQWLVNKSYDNYYEQCQSTHCTYSYMQNFDIFYLITSILALYSGLSTTLKILTPIIIFVIFSCFNRTKTRIGPFVQPENNIS